MSKGLVLVLEDDRDTREAFAACLTNAGYTVNAVGDSREALQQLLDHPILPELAIVDLRVPVMSGGELIRLLRNYVRLSKLSVLVVSAESAPAELEGLVCGALRKPVSAQQLLAAVAACIDHAPKVQAG